MNNQKLLQELLLISKEKAFVGITLPGINGEDDTIGKSYTFEDVNTGAIGFSYYLTESLDDPRRIINIHRTEWIKLYGDRIITNYSILQGKKGLLIEKHIQNWSPDSLINSYTSMEEIYAKALKGLEEVNTIIQSQKEERELGLNLVHDQEIIEIMDLIKQCIPFEN